MTEPTTAKLLTDIKATRQADETERLRRALLDWGKS